MIWLTWRQFRVQAVTVFALLAVLAALLVLAGRPLLGSAGPMTTADDTLYDACLAAGYGLPALIGVFWGAPLVTRELETGTHRLVWNQGVTRTRWLAVKLAVTGLAAVAASGLLSLAVTWWAGPVDAAGRPAVILVDLTAPGAASDAASFAARLSPLVFGARGVVPVGYAAFAFVLGVAAGILLRRTVPAMAATLVVYAAVQAALPFAVRPYVLPAAQETVTITVANVSKLGVDDSGDLADLAVAGPRGAWVLANETLDASGHVTRPPSWLAGCMFQPQRELTIRPGAEPAFHPTVREECFTKLAAQGYRQQVTYQPAGRFWALQWIETAIFLLLTALLTWLCLRWTRHRLT
ncbi:transporter [Nonomuraea zeae]|uniref:Transporter n=1 Tax=Nonomuraea zeae TaxID=1642303 RepID=A0A5S4GVA4_9ACTN|nr:transporter [Nonomuraea zeae]TMR36699.1 transporter [Nonomuraea zeae]